MRDIKEASMKFLIPAIAALSIAAVTSAAANVDPASVGKDSATNAATASVQPAYTIQAQRYYRRKCQEDLGYGRTGSYGCG
jgi:hypothetical protein